MKDVFSQNAKNEFGVLIQQLAEGLYELFPQCEKIAHWRQTFTTPGVLGDELSKHVKQLETPLLKGVKYGRAVQSITGSPATTFHALSYKDLQAGEAACPDIFGGIDFFKKLAAPNVWNAESRNILWKYVDEINKKAYQGSECAMPVIPSVSEISDNIQQRRKMTTGPSRAASSNMDSVLLVQLKELYKLRGVQTMFSDEDLSQMATAMYESVKTQEWKKWRTSDDEAINTCTSHLHDFGTQPIDEAQLSCLKRILEMSSLHSAIPSPLLQNMEAMAQNLVENVQTGKMSLDDIDFEDIGNKVLSGMSQEDVNELTKNFNSIFPPHAFPQM